MHISRVTLSILVILTSLLTASCSREARPERPAGQSATLAASPKAGLAGETSPTGEAHPIGDAPAIGEARPTGEAPPAGEAPPGRKEAALAPSGRLSRAQIDAYGLAPDSSCRAHKVDPRTTVGGCSTVGPFPGIIDGAAKSPDFERYEDALDACMSSPVCIGVSSSWYTGMPWFFVAGAAEFEVDDGSYGCTLLLDCPPSPS